jgi:hypothetical protein
MNETLSSAKIRLSKKFYAALPANVAERIAAIAADYRIASARFNAQAEGYKVYAGEGDRIEVIVGEKRAAVEMVSENTLGASGLCHSIGDRIAPPVGSFVITVSYYGGYWMTIDNIQPRAIAG